MRFARTAAAAAAVAALLIPATTHTAAATPRSHAAPGETVTLPVREALAGFPVREEDRTGYERSKFKHWVRHER
ncbi:hypothetical protein [Streptomyces sp. NRRL S-813]|uniref:hypothetical protein n=1 Tax=Streptomyces sp. NRRL S-813 TaxID=1463919 RepID=UPI00069039B7|nr:hypothetical protein [Streptomyces sp. NRRL S-813]